MPDPSNIMCVITMPRPRIRHWSAPERLQQQQQQHHHHHDHHQRCISDGRLLKNDLLSIMGDGEADEEDVLLLAAFRQRSCTSSSSFASAAADAHVNSQPMKSGVVVSQCTPKDLSTAATDSDPKDSVQLSPWRLRPPVDRVPNVASSATAITPCHRAAHPQVSHPHHLGHHPVTGSCKVLPSAPEPEQLLQGHHDDFFFDHLPCSDMIKTKYRTSKCRESSMLAQCFTFKSVVKWGYTSLLLVTMLCCIIFSASSASAKICKENVVIHNLATAEEKLRNCTIIEGSLAITNELLPEPEEPEDITSKLSFPELREITDYFLLYKCWQITKLDTLFPNLAVIRGNNLLEGFALIIVGMKRMEEIGLLSLTHILQGGVKIERNIGLCYVDSIRWKSILVDPKYHTSKSILIDENGFSNNCPNDCPVECVYTNVSTQSFCWNQRSCQKLAVVCPEGSPLNAICYRKASNQSGQIMACHSECLGECSGTSISQCHSCKHVFLEENADGKTSTCSSHCAEPNLLHENWRCISMEHCMNMTYTYNDISIGQTKPFKAYNGKCLARCPEETREKHLPNGTWICEECWNCPSECQGSVISNFQDLIRFQGCTTIIGDLTIQIRGDNVVEDLFRYLGKVRYITGSLKISRSFPIVSLDFFQSLEEIKGIRTHDPKEQKKHTLKILENENLVKLFPKLQNGGYVKIRSQTGLDGVSGPGKPFIHYNPQLCKQEIKRLLQLSGMEDPGENSAEISYATNGDKALCNPGKLHVTVAFDGMSRKNEIQMHVSFNNYINDIVESDRTSNFRSLLGYEIHVREIDQVTYESKNMTKFGGRDACGNDDWMVIDHPPSDQTTHDENLNKPVWPREQELIFVKPFTYYAVFVSTLIIKDVTGSSSVEGAQSDIIYVQTPEDYPSPPSDLTYHAINYSTIELSWLPPIHPNGIVDHYEIVLELKSINSERLLDVNFCDDRIRITKVRPMEIPKPKHMGQGETKPDGSPTKSGQGSCPSVCDCNLECKLKSNKNANNINKKLDEEVFEDLVIDAIFPFKPPPPRSRRSVLSEAGFSNEHNIPAEQKDSATHNGLTTTHSVPNESKTTGKYEEREIFDSDERVEGLSRNQESWSRPYSKRQQMNEDSEDVYVRYSARVPNVTKLVVKDLKHYSSYIIRYRACHRVNGQGPKRCSETLIKEIRTLFKPNADVIPSDPTVEIPRGNDTDVAWISWQPPRDPNSLIVNYNILSSSVMDENVKLPSCITAKNFTLQNHRFELKVPGSWSVKVQAVSLLGPGPWTRAVSVNITDHNRQLLLSILIPIALIIVAVFIFLLVFYFKVKQNKNKFTSNEAYQTWEVLFPRDEYWIDRDLVDVGELLGSGAFGEVHQGTYKHPTRGAIQVAIKMLRNNATMMDRRLFLEEANIMKNLKAAHIVELVGAVPNGEPSYILIEMMPNGDLKRYLRNSRPYEINRHSVRPPPTEQMLMQFAIEIADGMAYLSARPRSIVHRDLAARNCLLTADLVVKVGDFGRARDVYETEYYRQAFRGMVPLRWMAPESLRDGEYVTKSDVWSYGVVLWELATLAEEPYQGIVLENLGRYIVEEGGNPEIRSTFPESLASLMRQCWRRYPDDRPSFLDICRLLESHANDRFRREAFMYSAEAQDEMLMEDHLREEGENAPLQQSSNGNGGSNTNGDVHLSNDNGHAVMAAAAASQLGSSQVRPFAPAQFHATDYSLITPDSSHIRNLFSRFRPAANKLNSHQEMTFSEKA